MTLPEYSTRREVYDEVFARRIAGNPVALAVIAKELRVRPEKVDAAAHLRWRYELDVSLARAGAESLEWWADGSDAAHSIGADPVSTVWVPP